MLIKDIMKKPVFTVERFDSALKAYRLMKEKGIRRLPVVESGRLAGIVTEGDIREAKPSALSHLAGEAEDEVLRHTDVNDIMTRKVVTVLPDEPVERAALLMARHKIGGIPVMERNELVGIVTATDILGFFSTLLSADSGDIEAEKYSGHPMAMTGGT